MTDALKTITENTARHAGGNYMRDRYYDLFHPKVDETRTGKEIISQMKEKIMRIGGKDHEFV